MTTKCLRKAENTPLVAGLAACRGMVLDHIQAKE
jgi:hypothetical protein